MSRPLVSIVCLCYNHEKFIAEAVESVVSQTYSTTQIIVVDDASTDRSAQQIETLHEKYPQLEVILLQENIGNCRAFNVALKKVMGDFVIDFATDDVMLSTRIEKQVEQFSKLDSSYGIVFSDAVYIDEQGAALRHHTNYLQAKRIIAQVPQGDVFAQILKRYFVAGPTMMVKREVMTVLGGYDENLAYEDFDFWVRSSRQFKYAYLNECLTRIRRVSGSMSTGWYRKDDPQLASTYWVCKKAETLCRQPEEFDALRQRVAYEFRQSLFSENTNEAQLFKTLLHQLNGWRTIESILELVAKLPLPWATIRNQYHRLFYS